MLTPALAHLFTDSAVVLGVNLVDNVLRCGSDKGIPND
jgi:hypothetical protein